MDESGEVDMTSFVTIEAKDEPLPEAIEEIIEEASANQAVPAYGIQGPPLEAHSIGPQQPKYRISFPVSKTYYCNQRYNPEPKTWTIGANSRNEFQENLFTLCEPYLQRLVEYPEGRDVPCFAEKEYPSSDDIPLFVIIRDKTRKRNYKWDQITESMLARWSRRSDLMMQLYVFGTNIYCRQAWDTVKTVLLEQDTTLRTKTTESSAEQKLNTMVRRLRRIHYSRFVEKAEGAFVTWAQWILQAPTARQSGLSYSKPPPELMKNFVPLEQEPRRPTKRRLISGPAQREHTTDGFGFEDEVQAMRQTVSQIRDLVDMLDRRVSLLESKCQGFKQTVQGNPPKRARSDDEGDAEEEPVMDAPDEMLLEIERVGVNPDPLLDEDFFKQEYDDDDDE